MQKTDLMVMNGYNNWANQKILHTVARLNPDQFTAPNPCSGYGSIRGILVHILTAEIVWRERLSLGDSSNSFLDPEAYVTLEYLHDRWVREEESTQKFYESVTNERLESIVAYSNRRGETFEHVFWNIIMHVINHGTQHRSEVATILTGYGVSPGDLDFIHYLRSLTQPKETS